MARYIEFAAVGLLYGLDPRVTLGSDPLTTALLARIIQQTDQLAVDRLKATAKSTGAWAGHHTTRGILRGLARMFRS